MLFEPCTAHLGSTCRPETQELSGRHRSTTVLPLEETAEQLQRRSFYYELHWEDSAEQG